MRDLRKHLQSITLPVYATFDTYDDNPDEMAQRAPYDVWTISPNPRKPGWDTDGACDGYGLPRDTAHAYADLINAVPELLATIDDLTAKLEKANTTIVKLRGWLKMSDEAAEEGERDA